MKKVFKEFAAEPTFSIDMSQYKLPAFMQDAANDMASDAADYLETHLMRKCKKDHPWIIKTYVDGGNLEIPSTIYKSKHSFLKDYKSLVSYLNGKFKFVPSSLIDMEIEGGCHLNFKVPVTPNDGEFKERFFKNLRNFIHKNPAMVWAFLAPTDNQSSIVEWEEPLDYRKGHYMTLRNLYGNTMAKSLWSHETDQHLYRKVRRIELRFFVMPKTISEMELHIDFAQQLLNWVWDRTVKGKEVTSELGYLKGKKAYDRNYAINQVISVCREIEFPFQRLVKHGKIDNLSDRFDYHRGYLV